MMQIDKKLILECMGKVYEESKDCKLKNTFFDSIRSELQLLSSYFQTNEIQSFFLAIVFAQNYKGETVDWNDLIRYFDCNPMKILEYSEVFESLYRKGIFKIEKSYHRVKISGANNQFSVNEKLTEALLDNKPIPELLDNKELGIIDVLEELYKLGRDLDRDNITSKFLFVETLNILTQYEHLPLIKRVKQLDLEIEETFLLLYLIWNTVIGDQTSDLEKIMDGMYDSTATKLYEIGNIINGRHTLVKKNLIEVIESQFLSDTEIKLTDAAVALVKECGIALYTTKNKKNNVILPSEIVQKELLFEQQEMRSLDTISELLADEKFTATQDRLVAKGLPKGITILLHGAPGTGKTEIAKQWAKRSGRDIVKVEISQSKSMWFGESEKIIKRIFTDYKSYAMECTLTPILLFNEADAIISKRKESMTSNVAQTENAIQNIILEELENFEGILIATTNLVSNIDNAFERRFLFKVPFSKPNTKIRAALWQSKLSHLTLEECGMLAAEYDFSGGQIDNIVRKCEIEEILNGNISTLAQIQHYCAEESMITKRNAIGFGV